MVGKATQSLPQQKHYYELYTTVHVSYSVVVMSSQKLPTNCLHAYKAAFYLFLQLYAYPCCFTKYKGFILYPLLFLAIIYTLGRLFLTHSEEE